MLSRFNLAPGVDVTDVAKSYEAFFNAMRKEGLVEATGRVGRRLADTPMDTDNPDAPMFYVTMTFRDRRQLDASYDYIAGGEAHPSCHDPHAFIMRSTADPVFICWEAPE